MLLISYTVVLMAVATVNCRNLHGQPHSRTPSIEIAKPTEDYEIGAVDGMDEVDDMLLTEEQWAALRQRKAIRDVTKRWTEGPVSTDGSGNKYPQVPYVYQSDEPSFCESLHPGYCYDDYYYKNYCRKVCNTGFKAFPVTSKPLVENAIQHWKDHTCIEFVDITNEPESSVQRQEPHVLFTGDGLCSSWLGMLNKPDRPGQTINLGTCLSANRHGSRVHEIGHALGFFHEQSRSDRDDYIQFIKENVQSKYLHAFRVGNDDNNNIDYDYSSIMQYSPFGFSNSTNHNKVTLVPVDPVDLQLLGQRDGLSFRDKHLANKMYNCIDKWESKCGPNKPRTCGEGYTGKHCTCVCPPHKTGSQCEMEKPGSKGDYYYAKRNQALNEEINTQMRLTVKVPTEEDVIFVKSVVPPACKLAKVIFTTSNLNPNSCNKEFLHVVTDLSQLEGRLFCDADLERDHLMVSDQKIIINTIIRGKPYAAEGTTLWEAVIFFIDIPGCAVPTTAQQPTTTTTTTTTTTAAPPKQGPKECSNIFEFTYNPWSQVVYGRLMITFPKRVSSWTLELTFEKDITHLTTWSMNVQKTSALTATLTPKPWNMNHVAESVFTFNLHIKSDGEDPSKLISTKLNGDELCQ